MKVNDLIEQSLQIIGRDNNIMRTYPIFHSENIIEGYWRILDLIKEDLDYVKNVYWRILNVKFVSNKIKLFI